MPQRGLEGARVCRRNLLLLGAAGLAMTPAMASPPETRTELSLTAGSDIVVVDGLDAEFRPEADAFGLLGSTTLTGIDARQGNDQVSISKRLTVEAEIETFRTYLDLPAIGPLLDEFLAEPNYSVRALGVDGGAGFDTLVSRDEATVTAKGSFVHTDFEMGSDTFPDILNSAALNSRLTVGATGMTGGRGYGRVENQGEMTVGAEADILRTRMTFNMLELDDAPQNIFGTAQAIGLAVGGPGDILARGSTPEAVNAAGATLAVSATSTGIAPDISVTGATLASPSHAIRLSAEATGLLGEALADRLTNLGTLEVSASGELTGVEISVTPNSFSLPEVLFPEEDIETRVLSEARGMVGGGGGDTIVNQGRLLVSAETDFLTVTVAFTDLVIDGSSIDVLVDPPGRPDRPETGSIAEVAGILGDSGTGKAGDDFISNSGSISGTAKSVVQTATVSIAVPINSMTGQSDQGLGRILDSVSLGLSEGAVSAALAFATGIDGMGGADRIEHSGNLAIASTGQADTLSISADVLGFISGGDEGAGEDSKTNVSLGLDIYNTSTLGYAAGVGLSGGAGDDVVVTTAASTNVVSATAKARNLDLNVGFTTEDKSVALTGEAVYARLWSGAEATGIAGGTGHDAIQSDGTIITGASALSQSLAISADVDLVKTGVSLSGSFIDTAQIAEATATGIEAADAGDTLAVGGAVVALADTDAESIGIDISVTVASEKGVAGTGTATFSTTESLAKARGVDRGPRIDLGLAEPGSALTTTGAGAALSATAAADLQRIAVGLNAAVSMKGVGLAATLLKADSTATADATAFEGSAAADQLVAGGAMSAAAETDSVSSITGVAIAAASQGVGAGVSILDAMTRSNALATGLDLGFGNDAAQVRAPVSATATSVTLNNLNSISISGAKDGVAVGAALGRLGTSDLARAIGIEAGDGADVLAASGAISASATSETDQVITGISLGGVMNGVAAGVALIQSDGTSDAVATAVSLGAGDDVLTLSAVPLSATADADISGATVGVTVQGSYQGVGAGVSVIDYSTTANAAARAVTGGAGDDRVTAGGSAGVDARASAKDVGVTVSIGGAVYGVGAGGSALLGTTEAEASAIALDGGDGADELTLLGSADVSAAAETERTDVGISGSFAIGVAVAGNFVDATSRASAFAAGLSGDGLAGPGGADRLRSLGALEVQATAVTTGGSFTFAIPIAPVGLGANIASTEVEAVATARGLDGGAGDDVVQADAAVVTEASAEAFGTLVSLATVGLNYGDMSTLATASSTGIAGGDGADSLIALNALGSTASAKTDAQGVGIVFTGANVNSLGSEASATAAGMSGGAGDDVMQAMKGATVSAISTTPLLSVDVSLTGVSMSTITNASTALALGLDGGAGADRLVAGGAIAATAAAGLTAEQIGVAVTGAVAPDLTATGAATAIGVAAGDGADTADVQQVTSFAQAIANVDAVAVSLVGLGAGRAGVLPTATARGFDGGEGDDSLLARGAVNATALSIGESDSTTVVLTGMTIGDEATRALAFAAGAEGGAGADQLRLAVGGRILSNAAANAGATRVTLVGGGLSSAGARADSRAIGLGGGDGDDVLQSDGRLDVLANATATVGSTDVAIVGGSLVETTLRATGSAVGMEGGDGSDRMTANAALSVAADAGLSSNFLAVTGAGVQGSVVRREVRGEAFGFVGGAGLDSVALRGALTVSANAETRAGLSSWSLLAIGLEGAASRVEAIASGADLGDDDDSLEAAGAITVEATASTVQSSSVYSVAQVLKSDSRDLVTALAAGVRGGGGADRVVLGGLLEVNAEARGASSSISMSGAGAIQTNADRQVAATATGVEGGTEDDWLELVQNAGVRAYASGVAGSANGTLVGVVGSSLRFAADSLAVGLDGGAGIDQLFNTRRLDVESIALLSSDNRSLALLGGGVSLTGLFSSAAGFGLRGGDGRDTLVNRPGGAVNVSAIASASIEDASLSIAGGSLSSGLGRAVSTAVAMEGGDGDDLLLSRSSLSVFSNALLESQSSGFNVVGVAGSTSDLKAMATGLGLGGGGGDDNIVLAGALGVESIAQGDHSAANFSAIGLAQGLSAIAAESVATGIDAGAGANLVTIEAGGVGTVTAVAETFTRASTEVGIGAAQGRSAIASVARATGVATGNGADGIDVAAALTVNARPLVSIGTAQTVFAGGNGSESAGLARGEARGISDVGGGAVIDVRAPITVSMAGRAFGSGAASTTLVGNTNVAARLRVEGIAEGIRTGEGFDDIAVAADIRASLSSTLLSSVTVTSGALFSDGVARTIAESAVSGAGIFDPGGAGLITIGSGRTVEAKVVQADRLTGIAATRAFAESFGKTDGLDVDAISFATAFGRAELSGIFAAGQGTRIENAGIVSARSDLFIEATAVSFGNSGVFGEATSTAQAIIGSSTILGINAGKTLDLENSGLVTAVQRPGVSAVAIANGTGQGFTDPDATASANVSVAGLAAIGISMTGGRLVNSGDIDALVSPQVDRARTLARRQPGEGGRVDAFSLISVAADNNSSWGVRSQAGDTSILNTGTIRAQTAPTVNALAEAFGTGSDGDALAQILITALNTRAIAIETGDGNDVIENRGEIEARASVPIEATAGSVEGDGDPGSRVITPILTTEAIGIRTGGGADQVLNSGRIDAANIAIDTGADNDEVTLLNGTTLKGEIRLGTGDDLLTLNGKTFLPDRVDGGTGIDQVTATGTHVLQGGLANVERLLMRGGDEISLGNLAWTSSDWMRIEGGQVRTLATGFTSGSHTLTTVIRPDASNGRLLLTGGVAVPRGKIVVEKGAGGPYVNGTTWDVIQSNSGLNIGLLTVSLPDPTSLVSFSSSLVQNSRLRVNVAVKPMAGIARRGEARSLAAAFDRATPTARGEVARTISVLQSLETDREVRSALSALAPQLVPLSLQTGAVALDGALAVAGAGAQGSNGFAPGLTVAQTLLAPAQPGMPAAGAWAAGFDRAPALGGTQVKGQVAGFASGVAVPLGERARLGLSMTSQVAEGRADTPGTTGVARSQTAVARLDADMAERVRLSAAVAFGNTRFEGGRGVAGTLSAGAAQLSTDMPMAGVDAMLGWTVPGSGPLAVELGTRLAWRHVGMGSVAETGAAGLALRAESGRHERLEVAAGARLALAERPLGAWRVSGQFGAELVQGLGGAPETVLASFRDMPEFSFDLASGAAPDTRLGLAAGLSLRHERGPRFTLGAARGDATSPAAYSLAAGIGFDF